MTTGSAAQFPVNLDLAGKPVLVVGAGAVAARKVAALRRAGARITVVAPEAVAEISEDPEIRWRRRAFRSKDLASQRLVVTATDDPAVNATVHQAGELANIFVNSADDPANCSFTLPAVARNGDLCVAVSTNGRSPALARWLRQRFDRDLASGYSDLCELLAETRLEVRERYGSSEVAGWDSALDDGLLDLVRCGHIGEARALLRQHLGLVELARS